MIEKLAALSHSLKEKQLIRQAKELDQIVADHRELLDAKPTEQPGTWVKPTGEMVKVSKEPKSPPHLDLANSRPADEATMVDPTLSTHLTAPTTTVGL